MPVLGTKQYANIPSFRSLLQLRNRHESLRNEPAIELERTYKEVLRSVTEDILSPTSAPALAVESHRAALATLQTKGKRRKYTGTVHRLMSHVPWFVLFLSVTTTMGSMSAMNTAIAAIVQTFEDDYEWITNVVLSSGGKTHLVGGGVGWLRVLTALLLCCYLVAVFLSVCVCVCVLLSLSLFALPSTLPYTALYTALHCQVEWTAVPRPRWPKKRSIEATVIFHC